MATLESSNSMPLQTVKFPGEATANGPTSTLMFPVVAPVGTVAVICVDVALVTVATVPLNFTILYSFVLEKLVPVITTDVPADPMLGERLVIVGARKVKFVAEVAVNVPLVTEIGPAVA